MSIDPSIVTELAPTGKLHASINLGNPILANQRFLAVHDFRIDRIPSNDANESKAVARLRHVQDERDAMAQRVAILSLALQDLERRNASLVRLLHKHQVAVPLELVADNNRRVRL